MLCVVYAFVNIEGVHKYAYIHTYIYTTYTSNVAKLTEIKKAVLFLRRGSFNLDAPNDFFFIFDRGLEATIAIASFVFYDRNENYRVDRIERRGVHSSVAHLAYPYL